MAFREIGSVFISIGQSFRRARPAQGCVSSRKPVLLIRGFVDRKLSRETCGSGWVFTERPTRYRRW